MSGLAEILVDASGHMNENLAQSTFLMTRNAVPKSERTSGIVIDARNIYHVPAMVPRFSMKMISLFMDHGIILVHDL